VTYPLAISTWGADEERAVTDVLASGRLSMGDAVAKFEREFAEYLGSRYAIMVNSGSSANLLAVAMLAHRRERPLARGDEVIVPAVSWSTTYAPLAQYGLRMRIVDVDLETLNYDIDALAKAVNERTRCIALVNLLGNPNEMERIRDVIGGRPIALYEDNCEALGAEVNGQKTGTFGDVGTHSFFFSHHIATMEGGMVVTDDEELHHLALSLRAHGWTRQLPSPNRLVEKSDDPFYESFNFILPGYNLRPLEMSGAVGSVQLQKLPDFLQVRRANAAIFREHFADHPRFVAQREIGASSHFGFSLVLRPGDRARREDVVSVLRAHGVECRPVVAGNIARHRIVEHFDYEVAGTLEAADCVHERGLYVGNYATDLSEQITRLRDVLDRELA